MFRALRQHLAKTRADSAARGPKASGRWCGGGFRRSGA